MDWKKPLGAENLTKRDISDLVKQAKEGVKEKQEQANTKGKINKFLNSKVVSKDIIKKSPQATYDISATETEPAEYKNRFFKDTFEKTKRQLYFT